MFFDSICMIIYKKVESDSKNPESLFYYLLLSDLKAT